MGGKYHEEIRKNDKYSDCDVSAYGTLAACGKKDSGKDTSGNIVIDETQDKEAKESTSESETSGKADETKPPFEETKAEVTISVPAEVDTMRPILLGICKTMSGGRAYDGSDSTFFWDGIYAAIQRRQLDPSGH